MSLMYRDLMPCSVSDAWVTPLCAASSQLFSDSARTSITFSIVMVDLSWFGRCTRDGHRQAHTASFINLSGGSAQGNTSLYSQVRGPTVSEPLRRGPWSFSA